MGYTTIPSGWALPQDEFGEQDLPFWPERAPQLHSHLWLRTEQGLPFARKRRSGFPKRGGGGKDKKRNQAMKIRRRYPNCSNRSYSIYQVGSNRDLGLSPSQASKLLFPARISYHGFPGRNQCKRPAGYECQCHT